MGAEARLSCLKSKLWARKLRKSTQGANFSRVRAKAGKTDWKGKGKLEGGAEDA